MERAKPPLIMRMLLAIAFIARISYYLLPSVLITIALLLGVAGLSQGWDLAIMMSGNNSGWYSLIVYIGVTFCFLVTWYTNRILVRNAPKYLAPKIKQFKGIADHLPRLMGFAVFHTLILQLFYANHFLFVSQVPQWANDLKEHHRLFALISLAGSYTLISYLGNRLWARFHWRREISGENEGKRTARRIMIVLGLIIIILILAGFVVTNLFIDLLTTLLLGLEAMLFIITRKMMLDNHKTSWVQASEIYEGGGKWRRLFKDFKLYKEDKKFFRMFGLAMLVAMIIYIPAVFSVRFSAFIGSLGIVFLGLAVITVVMNSVTLLSKRVGLPLHLLFFFLYLLASHFSESHSIHRIKSASEPLRERHDPETYIRNWMAEHKALFEKDTVHLYCVLSNGGASRSAYWAGSVLGRLDDETGQRFSNHLIAVSGASGGSFGNALFMSTLNNPSTAGTRRREIRNYLRTDFLAGVLSRMLGTDLFLAPLYAGQPFDRADALRISMQLPNDGTILDELMSKSSFEFLQGTREGKLPAFSMATSEVRSASPGVLSTIRSDSLDGGRLDVYNTLEDDQLELATAVIMSSRFPYVSPAGALKDHYYVDGGYLDNSGAGFVTDFLLYADSLEEHGDSVFLQNLPKVKWHIIHLTNSEQTQAKDESINPVVNDLATPLVILAGSYSRQTELANLRLGDLLRIFNEDPDVLKYYHEIPLFESEHEVYPMSWTLSPTTIDRMDQRVNDCRPLNELIEQINGMNP